jgi:hypothetical protein
MGRTEGKGGTVKELLDPPQDGERETARYLLRDTFEIIGWTNNRKLAIEYKAGFGPVSDVTIEDTRLHTIVVGVC